MGRSRATAQHHGPGVTGVYRFRELRDGLAEAGFARVGRGVVDAFVRLGRGRVRQYRVEVPVGVHDVRVVSARGRGVLASAAVTATPRPVVIELVVAPGSRGSPPPLLRRDAVGSDGGTGAAPPLGGWTWRDPIPAPMAPSLVTPPELHVSR